MPIGPPGRPLCPWLYWPSLAGFTVSWILALAILLHPAIRFSWGYFALALGNAALYFIILALLIPDPRPTGTLPVQDPLLDPSDGVQAMEDMLDARQRDPRG